MTQLEAEKFIKDVLRGLWPDWDATDIQLTNWVQKLKCCDYQRAKLAVENVWRGEKIQHRRPPQGRIFEALSSCGDSDYQAKNHELPETSVFISCIEPPPHNPNRTEHKIPVYPADLSRMDEPEYMQGCGEYMAKRFNELYGGTWIVVIDKPKPDSGLRGVQARDKAFADILSGPDTKTKRWLQQYLGRKRRENETSGPVDMGELAAGVLQTSE